MKKKLLFFIAFVASCTGIYAQSGNVGIGTNTPNSTASVNGSLSLKYQEITATTYSITNTDNILLYNGTAAATFTLPAAGSCNCIGRIYKISNRSAFGVTISTGGSGTIDNNVDVNYVLSPNSSVEVVSVNTSGITWRLFSITTVQDANEKIFQVFTKTASQSTTTVTDVTWAQVAGNGTPLTFNAATGVITLPKNKSFLVQGYVSLGNTGSAGNEGYVLTRIVSTSNASVGTVNIKGFTEASTEPVSDGGVNSAIAVITTGNTDLQIKLRVIGVAPTAPPISITNNVGNQGESYLLVQEL